MTAWSLAVTGTKNKNLFKNLSIIYLNYIYGLGLGDGEGCVYTLPIFLNHLISWMQEHSLTDWGIVKITYLGLCELEVLLRGNQWEKHPSHQLRGKAGLAEVKCKTINTCKAALEMSLIIKNGFYNDIFSYNIKEKFSKRNNWWTGFPRKWRFRFGEDVKWKLR